MIRAIDIAELGYRHSGGGDERPALSDVTLTVAPGESVALVGASGAGKTTLLALIDGRLRGWRGRASVLGQALSPEAPPPRAERADVGFIFQEFALVERASVLRNVLNGRLGRMRVLPALIGRHGPSDLAAAGRALADCDIADLAQRRVDSLSGGQRQRVAIARCLAQEPRLILADEPVSNLDPPRARDILDLITNAARNRGATVVFSSHQPELARQFADRVIGLSGGRIVLDCPAASATVEALADLYRDSAMPPRRAPLRVAG